MATPDRALLAVACAVIACAGTAGAGIAFAAVAGAGIARAGGPPLDACAVLTAADVERVQGGSLREAISSGSRDAAESVATTQCFFRVEPFSSSVSLGLTRAGRGRAAQRELRERWARQLHPQERQGHRAERERGRGEEEPGPVLTPVAGLGEEAYLAGGHGNVSLYVLAPDAFLRLSVGGPGDAADWSRRVQALARAALARLETRPPPPPAH
jgi:hypothetical protein